MLLQYETRRLMLKIIGPDYARQVLNFYLDDKGIHFIYDPYEIDCYAAGTIDIFVPYTFR